jgi:hypothetical protein
MKTKLGFYDKSSAESFVSVEVSYEMCG